MRKALFLGVNDYTHVSKLYGCNNDAIEMYSILKTHVDGRPNFSSKVLTTAEDSLSRSNIIEAIKALFSGSGEVALLYFAGHGQFDTSIDEGVIIPQDYSGSGGVEGIRISDILNWATGADKILNKVIILDCCQAGSAGEIRELKGGSSILGEGITILTACKKEEYAQEACGQGVFTNLILQALSGGAANVLGHITPGSVYSFVDNALAGWEQRPVFKTNVSKFISLREALPLVPLNILRRLPEWFPEPSHIFPLDPSFEPTEKELFDPIKGEVFSHLQKCNRHSLVEPVDTEHMYFAAMKATGCRLTALGVYYRELALKERI